LKIGQPKKESRNPSAGTRALSDLEVARFLKQLANVYRDKRSGNPALADALSKVAERLSPAPEASPSVKDDAQGGFLPFPTFSELQRLDVEAITRFISDDSKTKRDLIELAAARFAIPRAQLQRLKLAEVREAIQASLRHEDSLNIITEEAERNGMTRKS
jgi:hypothetical protein